MRPCKKLINLQQKQLRTNSPTLYFVPLRNFYAWKAWFGTSPGLEWIHLGIYNWEITFFLCPLVWKKMIISKILVMQNTKMYMNEFIWGHTTGTEPSSDAPLAGKIWILAKVRKQSYKGHPKKLWKAFIKLHFSIIVKHYDALFNRKKSTWNQRIMVLKVQGCLRKNSLNCTSCLGLPQVQRYKRGLLLRGCPLTMVSECVTLILSSNILYVHLKLYVAVTHYSWGARSWTWWKCQNVFSSH